MIKMYVCALLLLAGTGAGAQDFTLGDLLGFTSYSVNKFDAAIGKKTFRRDYDTPRETPSNYNYIQERKTPEGTQVRRISLESKATTGIVSYQTTQRAEFDALRGELKSRGYQVYSPDEDPSRPVLYQAGPVTVTSSVEIRDNVPYYSLTVEKAQLPKPREIAFAEDLLPLKSHEYLVAAFGAGAVSKDVFHYSETETNRCSVLFPNTLREVIFIWEDEVNYREVSFLIIGGQTLTTGKTKKQQQMLESEWISRQGVYAGMKLEELQKVNEGPLSFHGFATERAGMLSKGGGKLDFNRLGLVFSCLNCEGDAAVESQVVNTENTRLQDRRIYVSTMIVIPEREKDKAVAGK